MTIGKREQIVIGIVSALVLIATLHILIFAPAADRYERSRRERADAESRVASLKSLADQSKLEAYNNLTDRFLQELRAGLAKLDLHDPEVFTIPKLEDFKFEPPQGTPPEKVEELKKEKWEELKKQKVEQQLDLIMEELRRLREFQSSQETTRLSFLGLQRTNPPKGWGLPTNLPPAMQTGELWDQLRAIADLKGTLNRLDPASPTYIPQQLEYERLVKRLGLDLEHAATLNQYGQFVPSFYKLAFIDLILQRARNEGDRLIGDRVLTREYLLDILDLTIPNEVIEGLNTTELYFAYEQLRYLNELIVLARELRIKDVASVELRAYGLLREVGVLPDPPENASPPPDAASSNQPPGTLPDDQMTIARVARITTPPPGAFAAYNYMQYDESGAPIGPPGSIPMGGPPGSMPMGGPPGSMPMGGTPSFGPGGMPMGGTPSFGPGGMPMGGTPSFGPGGMPMGGTPSFGPGGMPMGIGPGGVMMGMPQPVGSGTRSTLGSVQLEPTDLGYAIPIKIAVQGDNMSVLQFLYEVLRRRPMADLFRLEMRSLSSINPVLSDVEATPTFIFVPKLFETVDSVRTILAEMGETLGTTTSQPSANPPSPAPAGASRPTG